MQIETVSREELKPEGPRPYSGKFKDIIGPILATADAPVKDPCAVKVAQQEFAQLGETNGLAQSIRRHYGLRLRTRTRNGFVYLWCEPLESEKKKTRR